jgi:hypothetical protein
MPLLRSFWAYLFSRRVRSLLYSTRDVIRANSFFDQSNLLFTTAALQLELFNTFCHWLPPQALRILGDDGINNSLLWLNIEILCNAFDLFGAEVLKTLYWTKISTCSYTTCAYPVMVSGFAIRGRIKQSRWLWCFRYLLEDAHGNIKKPLENMSSSQHAQYLSQCTGYMSVNQMHLNKNCSKINV